MPVKLFEKPVKKPFEELPENIQKRERQLSIGDITRLNELYKLGSGQDIPEIGGKNLNSLTYNELETIRLKYQNNPGIVAIQKRFPELKSAGGVEWFQRYDPDAPRQAFSDAMAITERKGKEKTETEKIIESTTPIDFSLTPTPEPPPISTRVTPEGRTEIEVEPGVFEPEPTETEKIIRKYGQLGDPRFEDINNPYYLNVRKYYKAPTESLIRNTAIVYQQYDPSLTKQEAVDLAKTDLTGQALDFAKNEWERVQGEEEISKITAGFPERYKTEESELAKRLSKYGGQVFEEEIVPTVQRAYARTGRLAGGGLTEALAREGGKISRGIQEQLAPGGMQAFLSGEGLNIENLMGKAQRTGTRGQALQQYAQGLYGGALSQLGGAAQSRLGTQLAQQLASYQLPLQKELYGYQLGAQLPYQKSLLDYQSQLQRELGGEAGYSQFLSLILPMIFGGGIGALGKGGWAGVAKGALTGLTGKYY